MGAKTKSNPYRTQGEVAVEPPDGWSDRLARLRARKSQRSGRHGTAADGPTSSGDARSSLYAETIVVECTSAALRGPEQGAALSIRWLVPTASEDSNLDEGGANRLNELRKTHAQCVGWLYAIAEQGSAPADRALLRQQLEGLYDLLAGMTMNVVVMGYAGFKRDLSDAAPLLRDLVAALDGWTSGAPPSRIMALARNCLLALGWRDLAE